MAQIANSMNERTYFDNISATTAAFLLKGGLYGVTLIATWGGGSVTLQRLAGSGSTYIDALTSFTANGYATVSVPPGTYRFAVSTATGVYADMTAIARSA